jgi:hypothetical protein
MQGLLFENSQKGATLVNAVMTRSEKRSGEGSNKESEIRRALIEFHKVEAGLKNPSTPLEERSMTDEDSESTSDSAGANSSQSDPHRHQQSNERLIELHTPEEKARALEECHYDPLAGHFGARKTTEKVSRRYRWKGIRKDIANYCNGCLRCKRAVSAKHKPYGLLAPLPPPIRAWQEVTFDFITELPESRVSGVTYDAIMVVVCRLTKMSHYIPARADWNGTELAQAWIREVIRLHGVPERIISDRGPLMNATHWETFNYYLNSRRVLTSAYHPETDGQTERQNQTLEQYLRIYCTLEQDDWALWISIAEFAYNDSVHATTGITPFRANQGMDPRSANWPTMALGEGESPMAEDLASKVLSLQAECKRKIIAANAYQKEYADKKRLPIPFKIGDKVLVSNRHIRSKRPKKKLDWKYVGPGTILAQIGPTSFKVDVPGLDNVHPVFHASLLEPFAQQGSIPHPDTPITDTLRSYGDDVYEVEELRDRRQNDNNQWEYLVKWKGYGEEENSWEAGGNISANTLKAFWKKNNILPKRQSKPNGLPKRRGRPPTKKKEDTTIRS